MRPYTSDDSSEPDEMYLYDLFCVINHLGEMETGHYLCASRFGEQVSKELRGMVFLLTLNNQVVQVRGCRCLTNFYPIGP